MREALRELFSSKKFIVALTGSLAGALVQVASKHGLGWLDNELANNLAGIVVLAAVSYVGAQGAADLGKHAVEASASSEEEPKK